VSDTFELKDLVLRSESTRRSQCGSTCAASRCDSADLRNDSASGSQRRVTSDGDSKDALIDVTEERQGYAPASAAVAATIGVIPSDAYSRRGRVRSWSSHRVEDHASTDVIESRPMARSHRASARFRPSDIAGPACRCRQLATKGGLELGERHRVTGHLTWTCHRGPGPA